MGLGVFPSRGSYSQARRAAYRPGPDKLPYYYNYSCPLIWALFALEQNHHSLVQAWSQ